MSTIFRLDRGVELDRQELLPWGAGIEELSSLSPSEAKKELSGRICLIWRDVQILGGLGCTLVTMLEPGQTLFAVEVFPEDHSGVWKNLNEAFEGVSAHLDKSLAIQGRRRKHDSSLVDGKSYPSCLWVLDEVQVSLAIIENTGPAYIPHLNMHISKNLPRRRK